MRRGAGVGAGSTAETCVCVCVVKHCDRTYFRLELDCNDARDNRRNVKPPPAQPCHGKHPTVW